MFMDDNWFKILDYFSYSMVIFLRISELNSSFADVKKQANQMVSDSYIPRFLLKACKTRSTKLHKT